MYRTATKTSFRLFAVFSLKRSFKVCGDGVLPPGNASINYYSRPLQYLSNVMNELNKFTLTFLDKEIRVEYNKNKFQTKAIRELKIC